MDVLEAIRGRRAVRDYTDAPLEAGMVEGLITAATWAPTGMHRQPWCFFVLEDRAMLAACSAEAKAVMRERTADLPEMAGLREMLASPEFNIFYNAPALIVICATIDDEMAVKDCCLAAENLMLAAYAQGLGTCWIGFAEAWLNTPEGKHMLGAPEGFRAVAPIIIGHPAGPTAAPDRRAPDIRRVVADRA